MIFIVERIEHIPTQFLLKFHGLVDEKTLVKVILSVEDLTDNLQNTQNFSLFSKEQSPSSTLYILHQESLKNEIKKLLVNTGDQHNFVLLHDTPYHIAKQLNNSQLFLDQKANIRTLEERLALLGETLKFLKNNKLAKTVFEYSYRPVKGYYSLLKFEYIIQKLQQLYENSEFAAYHFLEQQRYVVREQYNPWKIIDTVFHASLKYKTDYFRKFLKKHNTYETIALLKKGMFILLDLITTESPRKTAENYGTSIFYVKRLQQLLSIHKINYDKLLRITETLLNLEFNIRTGKIAEPEEGLLSALLKIHSIIRK